MDRRKELVQQYKEIKTEAGIYQIKNNINQKILVASTNNLRSLNGKTLMLKLGSHRNQQLQKEWNEFGESAFGIEVLEVLVKKEGYFDEKDELKKLEEKWLQELQPYGDRGYNK
ncbi:GIY-YIG nuclease family protein [Paenibacillus radicis (ex Xue et al. 2023)]|uniref:GIY-YIG nuclease family protein n=1 Tax=Paenibacillus radicis (ex Xue et al. 2023) TaxID=2972489 RepID=A0ABT1YDK9_9BACL|nr:GIY-YIG nuclease family protein [Paenibacillus radicis (ex Xue et al. 2023)]MCR8630509.1 GIY-YIG nuclease family protein [Paenibacillus radicis (ex Xue et al. 2023)]